MNDENISQGARGKSSGRVLVSKIARLPDSVREQLNRRLRDNEPASTILPWLNELPEVRSILSQYFGGVLINHQNLSKWRHGGYERWLEMQAPFAEVAALAGDAEVFSRVSGNKIARGTAVIIAARILKMIRDTSPDKWTADELVKLSHAVTALSQVEQNNEQLELDKEELRLKNEMTTLAWDKHQRTVVEIKRDAIHDIQSQQLEKLQGSNEAKIELIGHRTYGKHWLPREVPETWDSTGKGPG